MKRNLVYAATCALALLLTGANALAQCERTLVRGRNLVGLPTLTPLENAQDVCEVFGQAGSPTTSIRMYTGTAVFSYVCDQVVAGFTLRADEGIGLEIIESGAVLGEGVLEGDHDPATVVTVQGRVQRPHRVHAERSSL